MKGELEMAIKNYTTKIPVHDTIADIHKALAKHKAKKVMFDYSSDGRVECICFSIDTNEGERAVKLPGNAKKVQQVLQEQKKKNTSIDASMDQAERVAWRIVKDWTEAQLAILETEMVDTGQIFLPYFTDGRGNTVYDLYRSGVLLEGLMIGGAV